MVYAELKTEKKENHIENIFNTKTVDMEKLFRGENIELKNGYFIEYEKDYNNIFIRKKGEGYFFVRINLDKESNIIEIKQEPDGRKESILKTLNNLEEIEVLQKNSISKIENTIKDEEIMPAYNKTLSSLNKFSISKKEPLSSENKPWWENIRYTKEDFFEINPQIKRRKKDKYFKIDELVSKINKNASNKYNNFFMLPNGLSKDFIPVGRIGYGLERDEKFYENTKKVIGNESKNTLFINYTGHSVSVGAALAEQNIPISWEQVGNERSINSLQDWIEYFVNNNNSNNTNGGILLEPMHSPFYIPIIIESLPTPQEIKKNDVKKVVVLTENNINEKHTTSTFINFETQMKNHKEFQDYLKNLEKNGIEVEIKGVDYR